MNGANLTELSGLAGDRYELMLSAFLGAFMKVAVGTRAAGSDRARSRLRQEAYAHARSYLASEADMIASVFADTAVDGRQTTEASVGASLSLPGEDATDQIVLLREALEDQLRLQIERDVALMVGALRGISLSGALRGAAGASGKRGGGIAAKNAEGALGALRFEFLDRSGRRWPSPRHVRTLWRHGLVLTWNTAALLAAAEIGLDQVEITHPDASHGYSGELVLVHESESTDEAMSWADAQLAGIFHPQSNAWLRPVSQP